MDRVQKIEIFDLTLDSDDEEEEDKSNLPNNDANPVVEVVIDSDETSSGEEKILPVQLTADHQIEKSEHPLHQRSLRNLERDIEKAVEEIRRGGSLVAIASYYQLPEDVLYSQLIVSRDLPKEGDLLTKKEEIGLINWILKSNKNNGLVMKHQLMEKVGKMRKVMKITPIFARSKFGKKWYDYFLKSYPEVCENDGILVPSDQTKQIVTTNDKILLYGIKDAVVVLHDFMKEKSFYYKYNKKCDVYLPSKIEFNDFKIDKTEDFGDAPKNEVVLPNKSCRIKSDPDESEPEDSYTSSDSASDDQEKEHLGFKGFEHVENISNIIDSIQSKKNNSSRPTCEKCQKSFCNKQKLQRHVFSHIPKELYTITCHKCLKTFPSKYHFLVHLKISHSEKHFECNQCDKVFRHQTSLSKHLKNHHSVSGKMKPCTDFICDICSKAFIYKNSLAYHIKYGHLKEEKPYRCNICSKKFIKASLMARHRLKHSKIKPLSCNFCGKTYSRKYLLREHTETCKKNKNKSGSLSKDTSKIVKEDIVID